MAAITNCPTVFRGRPHRASGDGADSARDFSGHCRLLLNLVLARLVSTQRDQIAVLKAFGYANWEVGLHFLKLVLVVVLAGSAVGIGLGRWLGKVSPVLHPLLPVSSVQYEAGLGLMVGSVAVSIVAALAGALQSVGRVVNLPPPRPCAQNRPPAFGPPW